MCKVKVSLYLISEALCHEDIWGSVSVAPSILTLTLNGGEWSASHPCYFTPGEGSPGPHLIEGWLGPRVEL
jgi:hypothetical protein